MEILRNTKSIKHKNSLLKLMSEQDCFFEALYEIVNNIYLRHLKIPAEKIDQLQGHLKILERIHKRPKSKRERRRIVKQTGGFIGYILPLLTSVITEIVSNALSKKSNTSSS